MNKCGVEKHRLLFVCSSCFVSNDTKKDEVGGKKMQKALNHRNRTECDPGV